MGRELAPVRPESRPEDASHLLIWKNEYQVFILRITAKAAVGYIVWGVRSVKSQGFGKWAPAATRIIAFAPELPFPSIKNSTLSISDQQSADICHQVYFPPMPQCAATYLMPLYNRRRLMERQSHITFISHTNTILHRKLMKWKPAMENDKKENSLLTQLIFEQCIAAFNYDFLI